MKPIVLQNLAAKEQSKDLEKLCQRTIDLVRRSRTDMSQYYERWDAGFAAYQNEIKKNESDAKANERGEPQKLVVPFLFAQVMAFIAFVKTLYDSRRTFYELEPVGEEDVKTSPLAEQVLDQDLRFNQWNIKLFQILLDISICNLGIVCLSWETKKRKTMKTVEPYTEIINGIPVENPGGQEEVEEVYYEGNAVRHVSPYRFFPDTRLPIARYREGEFCGSYDEWTKIRLREYQNDGFFQGVEHIGEINDEKDIKNFHGLRLDMFTSIGSEGLDRFHKRSSDTVAVVHVQRWIIPSEYKIDDEPIGPEDVPILYDIWIANEKRIIRLAASAQAYEGFSYFLGQYDCSNHSLIAESLAGKIQELQFLSSWLMNSHVASVRKTIQNWLVVDPAKIEMSDLKERNPVIRLKQTMRGGKLEDAIKQLDVRDVTQNHISDVSLVKSLIEYTTGITENLLGNFAGGRRSAREAQQVFQSAASRLELIASNIDEQLFRPLGEAMLSNSAEYITLETLVRISGVEEEMTPDKINAMFSGQGVQYGDVIYFKLSKDDIKGRFNFRFVSTTSPSQKGVLGSMLIEIFDRLAQNPQGALMSNLNPGKIVREALKLQGVTNLNQFSFTPQELLTNASLLNPNPGGAEAPGDPASAQEPGGPPPM